MIPKPYITVWSKHSPWKSNYLVEQDLIIERALSEIFSDPDLNKSLAFRGGTAIHKLFFETFHKYLEHDELRVSSKEFILGLEEKLKMILSMVMSPV